MAVAAVVAVVVVVAVAVAASRKGKLRELRLVFHVVSLTLWKPRASFN